MPDLHLQEVKDLDNKFPVHYLPDLQQVEEGPGAKRYTLLAPIWTKSSQD